MASQSNSSSPEHDAILRQVLYALRPHIIPDSRFHTDLSHFTPDFRKSSAAIARLTALPAYTSASTILATCDNSLEELRYQALKDGKKLLVGTYKLLRGFVLLEPRRLAEHELRLASLMEGMEKPGIGRYMTLVQLYDEHVEVDLCVTGAIAVSISGVVLQEGTGSCFGLQWGILRERKILKDETIVVAVVHDCQVVDVAGQVDDGHEADGGMPRVRCDIVITPEKVLQEHGVPRKWAPLQLEMFEEETRNGAQSLQELVGIRMMDAILSTADLKSTSTNTRAQVEAGSSNKEEDMGRSMVDELMKQFRR